MLHPQAELEAKDQRYKDLDNPPPPLRIMDVMAHKLNGFIGF